jgi:hypothetical protein
LAEAGTKAKQFLPLEKKQLAISTWQSARPKTKSQNLKTKAETEQTQNQKSTSVRRRHKTGKAEFPICVFSVNQRQICFWLSADC